MQIGMRKLDMLLTCPPSQLRIIRSPRVKVFMIDPTTLSDVEYGAQIAPEQFDMNRKTQ